ncbi:MAG: hypothetical protein RL480_1690, partial [Pseudomonadota bacterium]
LRTGRASDYQGELGGSEVGPGYGRIRDAPQRRAHQRPTGDHGGYCAWIQGLPLTDTVRRDVADFRQAPSNDRSATN